MTFMVGSRDRRSPSPPSLVDLPSGGVDVGLTVDAVGDRELVLRRRFAASRRLVFDAFTRPELLVRWYGARGWNLVGCDVDLRPGGAYRFVSRGPGGDEMAQAGVFREVDPPARLVMTELFDEQSYPGETLIVHDFAELDGVTTVRSTISYATPAGRDAVLRYPMARGVAESGERLEALLRETTTTQGEAP
jgi:uncharacterized protein YndB with AHSA1/START domain